MTLVQLKRATSTLAVHVFRPETSGNRVRQANSLIDFCNNYHLQFLYPVLVTVCYITHLTTYFTAAKSIRSYVSRFCCLHKQPGMTSEVLDSFLITSFLTAADFTMRTSPLCSLPILPHLMPTFTKSGSHSAPP